MDLRIPLARQPVEHRPTRIRQLKEFGDLVETFTRCVIKGSAEHVMIQFAADVDQEGVAAADNQRNVRLELQEPRLGRIAGDPGRIQVGLMMMDAVERFPQHEGEPGRAGESCQQCRRQPRAAGDRHCGDVLNARSGRRQRGPRHREEMPQVFPGRQFGNHAPVLGMEADL